MYPWLSQYPEGMPREIEISKSDNILDELLVPLKTVPNQIAYSNMGREFTFSQVDALSTQFASFLQNCTPLKPQSHVAIQLPNLLQYPIVLFGILKAGMIAVNTNPLYTARELEHQYKDSEVEALIVLENFAHVVEKIIDKTNINTVIISKIGDLLGTFKGAIVNTVVKHVKKIVPKHNLNGIPFKKTLQKGAKTTFNPVKITGDNIAFLQYTGGTTGVSKGAVLTHYNIVANMRQAKLWLENNLDQSQVNTVITPLPLYHIFSLTINCLFLYRVGCKNVLITNPKDLQGFIKEMSKHKFAIITGVNTLYNALLTQEKFRKMDFSFLKICCAGGMAVQDYVAKEWEKVTGKPLIEGYGLTESSPAVAFNPLNGEQKLGSIGVPLPSTIIEIRDENDQALPPNEIGEICCYGPQIMREYWNNEEETKKTLKDGWLYTGDMAFMYPNGFIEIVDRKKDMINVSGFNVFPFEIENIIMEMDEVLEVAAVAVSDKNTTEAVKIYIVPKSESLTEEQVRAYCKNNLTNYKRPKYIEFRETLPKSVIGKILKKDLR